MKTIQKLTWLGAIALATVFGTVACTDSDNLAELNPGYNEETGEVPVQFVFNVTTGNTNAQTRMKAENTQADPLKPFRGIQDTRILTYALSSPSHVSDTADATRMYDMATILAAGSIDTAKSNRVIEMSLPNGTNAMMFYGRAIKNSGATAEDHAAQGHSGYYVHTNNKGNDTHFTLMSRVSQYEYDLEGNQIPGETDAYKVWMQTKDLLVTILNRISENGLHYETATGPNGTEPRDLRARIWWPTDIANYKLEGPLYKTNAGGIVALTASNSNIAEVGEGTTGLTITYTGGGSTETVGTYTAATKTLPTNVDSYKLNIAEKEWKSYGDSVKKGKNLTALEEILGNAYNKFTEMKTTGGVSEIRAGSASAIVRVIEDLWTVTNEVYTATPTSYDEAVAHALAARIFTRFYTYFTATIDEKSGIVTGCELKSPTDLVTQVLSFVPDKTEADFGAINKPDYTQRELMLFPTNKILNLPPGATQLLCKNGVFSYNDDLPMGGMGGGSTTPLKYTWPAELLYYGNSPLRTSNETLAPSSFPNGANNWEKNGVWSTGDGWTDMGQVLPTTRSVAMKYNIKYGTSMLATSVYYDTNLLEDNNEALNGAANNVFDVDKNSSTTYQYEGKSRYNYQRFVLTGVVVGGQPQSVGWDFVRWTKDESNTFTYLVYDNDLPLTTDEYGLEIPGYTASKQGSDENYTLVFDNWNSSNLGKSQNSVYIALEFKNCSGRDFWGKENLVRDGGTFYLIGELNPNKALVNGVMTDLPATSATDLSEGINWPADSKSLPPFDASGSTIKQRRVFIQDYVTRAKFGLGKYSLQNAYVAVPDLRSANISLGLSVDIEWKNGLEYDVVIGGK